MTEIYEQHIKQLEKKRAIAEVMGNKKEIKKIDKQISQIHATRIQISHPVVDLR